MIKALEVNPHDRLGVNGPESLKEHKWFEGFDWAALEANTLQSPMKNIV